MGRCHVVLTQNAVRKHYLLGLRAHLLSLLPGLVRGAWEWVREKFIGLLSGLGQTHVVSDEEIILALYPKYMRENECLFLLWNCIQLVDKEVFAKQKELLVDSLRGA